MEFSLGLMRNNKQIFIKQFNEAGDSQEKTIDISILPEENIQLLCYQEAQLNEEVAPLLEEEKKFYPLISQESLGLNLEDFASLSAKDALNLYRRHLSKWILVNNIASIEEVFSAGQYLKDLWKSDRQSFFEELWFILRSNLGSSFLKILFHDLDPNRDEGNKDKLIAAYVEGQKTPEYKLGTEAEEKIMKDYGRYFGPLFEVTDHNVEKGQVVAVASINDGPVLIMAQTEQWNRLQKAFMVALFDGLQERAN